MKIAILMYSPAIGGGTFVIYEYTKGLMALGHDVRLITDFNVTREWISWYPEAKDFKFMSFLEAKEEKFDIAYATWWATVPKLSEINATKYAYFVQSFEPYFVSEDNRSLRKYIESTYIRHLPVITEATWIKNLLEANYQSKVYLVKNGIRKDIFKPDGLSFENRDKNKLRILIEGPIDVPFKNVPRTIELCREANVGEIWLLTSSNIDSYPGVDKVFSKLSIFDTPLVYRSCDILVKLSYVEGMFGPPLEMFHCGGVSVVYDVTGHDEYIENNKNSFVVKRDNEEKVIKYLKKLKNDPELLERMKVEAMKTADKWYGWDEAVSGFESATLNILRSVETPNRGDLKCIEIFLKSWNDSHQTDIKKIEQSKFLSVESTLYNFKSRLINKIKSVVK